MDAIREFNAEREQGDSDQPSIRDMAEPEAIDLPLEPLPEIDEEPRAEAGSNIVLTLTPRDDLTPGQLATVRSDPLLSGLQGSNVFELDSNGVMTLAGLEEIPLLGLPESDIERRLSAVQLLEFFEIEVRLLDTEPTGQAALQPFGYDILSATEGSLKPPQSGPVPPDYILGPGDSVRVQLFGNVNGIYEYEVSRDGVLNLPEVGPVTVAGIPFSEFRRDLNERVRETLIGTQVSVSMGPLRTIRVFVLGDVNRPGSYVVGGLATISSALYESGGISKVGTLRNVQLKRGGRLVGTLDLYDLLLAGDNSGDRRLQPGDVVFVPPVGPTAGVSGAVRRPAIYETKGRTTAQDLVALAGGLSPDAFGKGTRIERIAEDHKRRVLAVDLSNPNGVEVPVRAGDVVLVPQVLPDLSDSVVLTGHVQRPGSYQWFPGMRLADLISSPMQLKPGFDDGYVIVRRERARGEPVQVLSADFAEALRNPSSAENLELGSRDTVYVFDATQDRQRVLAPLLDELSRQATFELPFQKVEVVGKVRAPGVYPLEPGMRISDLLRAGGALLEEAYALGAELTRYSVDNGSIRQAEVVNVNLERVLRGELGADLLLLPHDHLSITRIAEWESTWSVRLEGEVTFPGEYRIRRGETLQSVLERAGGLTEAAFPEGAVFLRESLKRREQEQVEVLARRLEADLASQSLASIDTTGSETLATGQALLEQLRNYQPVGRLVLNVEHLVVSSRRRGGSPVELRHGDRLMVPQKSQVVTVIGEAQQNTSHLYQQGLSRDDYIDLSGGLTRRADKKLIYVVRASGAVVTRNRSRWLGSGQKLVIQPGDTIVVPLETDRIRPLTFWTSVTQILYQGAIAVAAIQTFGD
ncbi:MAG: SLBB domain-containing protein [Pseudomonadota bacterium]